MAKLFWISISLFSLNGQLLAFSNKQKCLTICEQAVEIRINGWLLQRPNFWNSHSRLHNGQTWRVLKFIKKNQKILSKCLKCVKIPRKFRVKIFKMFKTFIKHLRVFQKCLKMSQMSQNIVKNNSKCPKCLNFYHLPWAIVKCSENEKRDCTRPKRRCILRKSRKTDLPGIQCRDP